MEQLITFTYAALNFIKKSIAAENCVGVRLDVVAGGCQGMTYELEFVNKLDRSDLIIDLNGIRVCIASKAVLLVAGTNVDYVKTPVGGSLVFENPNAKFRCGCGKSFCVDINGGKCGGKCVG